MKDAAAQPPADEHPVDDQTIQNWSICARVPRRDTVSVRGNNRRSARSRPAMIVAQRNHRWLRPSHEIRRYVLHPDRSHGRLRRARSGICVPTDAG